MPFQLCSLLSSPDILYNSNIPANLSLSNINIICNIKAQSTRELSPSMWPLDSSFLSMSFQRYLRGSQETCSYAIYLICCPQDNWLGGGGAGRSSPTAALSYHLQLFNSGHAKFSKDQSSAVDHELGIVAWGRSDMEWQVILLILH